MKRNNLSQTTKKGGVNDYIDISNYLKENLSSARYKHTLGTWKTAVELAKKHKCYDKKVDLAALLHDAGKGVDKNKLINYVLKHKIKIPYFKETIKHSPWVMHGFVSADIARKIFKIKDKSVLSAIVSHTIGSANMSKLDKIIYLADITAPDRRFPKLKTIRWHAKRNIDKAVQMAMENKIHHVLAGKKWLHPVAVMAWNNLLQRIGDRG